MESSKGLQADLEAAGGRGIARGSSIAVEFDNRALKASADLTSFGIIGSDLRVALGWGWLAVVASVWEAIASGVHL